VSTHTQSELSPAAMESAVTQGMGLLTRQNLGSVTPDYTPTVVALSGMSEAQ
jgi:hypothetical protein